VEVVDRLILISRFDIFYTYVYMGDLKVQFPPRTHTRTYKMGIYVVDYRVLHFPLLPSSSLRPCGSFHVHNMSPQDTLHTTTLHFMQSNSYIHIMGACS